MKKTIIATLTIWLIIIIAFSSILGKGAVRTVKVGEKSQLWFTGIYITVLDYKRVYPSVSKKEFEPMKYIAFKVLLDGRKERTGGDPPKHFGNPVGCDGLECYETCGNFYVEGDIGEKKNIQIHSISPSYAAKVLGDESPIIGLGKVDSGVVEGWVFFKVPEEFEIKKFIYRYREHNDFIKRVFPKVEVQVLLNEPIK
jgi:hypothetical protein